MMHSGITLCLWKSPAPSAGNTRFYLSSSVSAKQSSWPRNPTDYRILATDARVWECTLYKTCHVRDTSTSMTHGQAYHKMSKLLVNGESGCVNVWRQKDITLNIWTKRHLFRANTWHNWLFSATNSLPRKTHCFTSFPLQLFKSK